MHCEEEFPKAKDIEPLFLREARRRMYAAAYCTDKIMATFFGRPPMAIWRYSSQRPPLDISDKAITSDDPSVANAEISKLDSAGWNTEGRIRPTSFIRLRCQQAVITERCLEQSLSGKKDHDMIQKLQ